MKYKLLILLLITFNAHAATFTCTDSSQPKSDHLAPLLQVNYRLRPIFEGPQKIIGEFTLTTLKDEIAGSIVGVNDGSGSLSLYRVDEANPNNSILEGTLQINHTGEGVLKLQNSVLPVSCNGQLLLTNVTSANPKIIPANISSSAGPLPVVASQDQAALLRNSDPKLVANKRLAYDFYRIILLGLHLERIEEFMRTDYIQHNPNVDTGMEGFLKAFSKLGPPRKIPNEIPDLVSIQAENDLVTMSFVSNVRDAAYPEKNYTSTWFDMFRIQNGKIAEHWDCDLNKR